MKDRIQRSCHTVVTMPVALTLYAAAFYDVKQIEEIAGKPVRVTWSTSKLRAHVADEQSIPRQQLLLHWLGKPALE